MQVDSVKTCLINIMSLGFYSTYQGEDILIWEISNSFAELNFVSIKRYVIRT